MEGGEQSRVMEEVVELLKEVAGRSVGRQERCGWDLSFARAARVLSVKEWQP